MVKNLEKIGFLSPRVEDEEIGLLNKHDLKVAHNPSTNMKLAEGAPRVRKMLDKGLSVGLGADSPSAGTVRSVVEQMKLSVLTPRVLWGLENWVFPDQAFEMGTLGGQR